MLQPLMTTLYISNARCAYAMQAASNISLGGHVRWQQVRVAFDELHGVLQLLLQVPGHLSIHVCEQGRHRWLGDLAGTLQGLNHLQGQQESVEATARCQH